MELNVLNVSWPPQFIIICKPGKGQGDAFLDKLDYIAKIEKILSDKTAFMQVNKKDSITPANFI